MEPASRIRQDEADRLKAEAQAFEGNCQAGRLPCVRRSESQRQRLIITG